MKRIEEIDKNFKVETKIQKNDIKFYNAFATPFKLYGSFYENGRLRRMPETVARSVSDGVYSLHANTAGVRIRFKTDSPYVAISAKMPAVGKMPHFALTGSAGFDLYEKNEGKERYLATFMPPFGIVDGYESIISLHGKKMRELTINLPLYSDVSELYIGLADSAEIEASEPYRIEKPAVFYGSSITQGGCASRAGNAYQAIISRRFDCNFINLGFSGNAKGEDEMAEYIAGLDMSLFVYDYDHNAPSPEHLSKTHEKLFMKLREKHPTLPVIMLTRPKFLLEGDEAERLAVVKQTYENAVARGDKNVYFISGSELMKYAECDGTVDNCHPNDLGFASMARVLGDFIDDNDLL